MGAAKQKQVTEDEMVEKLTADVEEEVKDDEGVMQIPLDDDEAEVDIPGEPPTRDEKRRNRWAEHKQAREAAEQRATDLERQLAEERGRAQAMEAARQYQQAPQPQQDPFAEQERMILAEIQNLRKDYGRLDTTKVDQEDIDRFQKRWMDLDTAHKTVITRREIARAQQQQQPANPQAQATEVHVRMNYPEIADNAVALQYTHGLLIQAQAERTRKTGRQEPPSMQMLDEALKKTRTALGIGPSPAPSAATRARFSGVSGSSQGAPAQSNGRRMGQISKEERSMARARWPKLEPEKAYKLFLREQSKSDEDA